ncbi:MAG TPA: hypothetical protein VMU53_02605 [Candidatus Sulfotelmatobacter sp.]|nr:hypothetical protein [Candidatus Sulfotelmatobacter sp.]
MRGQNERAAIVGFDGVIAWRTRRGSPSAFEFLPGALKGLRLLRDCGYTVLAVVREEIGRNGSANENQQRIQRMRLEVALAGGRIERVYTWSQDQLPYSELLKRMMAEQALRASNVVLVSDSVDELEAGAWLGCRGILLRRDAFLNGRGREGKQWPEIASSLNEAAERLIHRGSVTLGELLKEKMRQDATTKPQSYFLQHVLVNCYGSWEEGQELKKSEEKAGERAFH